MLGRAIGRKRYAPWLVLVVASRAVAAPPSPDATATDAEVFARVFKRPLGPEHAPVVLIVDGVIAGSIQVELSSPEALPSALSSAIVAAVGPKLRSEAKAKLVAATRAERVTIEALGTVGLDVVYDSHKLELRIGIPARLTERSSHDLGMHLPANAEGALEPSAVSGYVNLRAGAAGTWTTGGEATAPATAHVNVDSALNIHGWVLEGRADAIHDRGLDGSPVAVHRGDVLLSHDVPASALRYLAGDFAVPFAGLQPSFPVLGLGVIRNFALQPYRIIQPIGTFDFLLDRPSTVIVLVNGAAVQKLVLPAGRHDVRDLPLGAGVNQVELLIRDDAGLERRLSFSTASPNELLAPGIVQFSLTFGFPLAVDIGLPLATDPGLRTYDFAHPILSGRRRWGVTTARTLGASLDVSFERARAGAEIALASTFGNLAFEPAASCDLENGCGHAESVRYDYTRGTANTIALVEHHYSPGFRDITVIGVDGNYQDDVSISTTRTLPERVVGRLNVRYEVGRNWPDAHEVSLGLSRSFGSMGMSALLGTRADGVTLPETRLFVTAHWILPERHGSVHAVSRASTVTGLSNELTYTTGSGPPPGGLVAAVTLEETPTDYDAGGALEYTGGRFTSMVSVASTVGRSEDMSQTGAIELATALAFAGGRFAWSRPITGSFALVENNQTLDGIPIEVDPALGGHTAETNGFGLGVVPNLDAYRVGTITVAAPTLPAGASLGAASYAVLPTYKSGTLVRVGEDGTVFLRGTLVDGNGDPLAFATADVSSLDHREQPAIPLMTNRAGKFSLMGLAPGSYAVRISGSVAEAKLEIPSGFSGVYSAGIITVVHQ